MGAERRTRVAPSGKTPYGVVRGRRGQLDSESASRGAKGIGQTACVSHVD
jgi:hypothetical protein